MNYEQEVEKLNKGSDVWKPELGSHAIVILKEPEFTEFKDDDGKITPQLKLLISVNKEQKEWYIGLGKTTKSCYGQLMVIGKERGKLAGETLTILVNQENKKNSYMIPDALEIIKKNEANKREEKCTDGQQNKLKAD